MKENKRKKSGISPPKKYEKNIYNYYSNSVLLLEADNFENIAPMEEFQVDWVNLAYLGLVDTLALSALPGCRYVLAGLLEHRCV